VITNLDVSRYLVYRILYISFYQEMFADSMGGGGDNGRCL